MFHNFAIPAPAWFIEGFAEYVATADFKRNGEWTFGFPAHHRAWSVQNGPSIPIERLLSDDYSEMNRSETASFYGWAWALTHMLYSDPEMRGEQISAYLNDINSGMDSIAAARKNFGDLKELDRRLSRYVRRSMGYSKSDKPIPYRDDVTVTTLDDEASELVGLTLERLASREPLKLRKKLVRFAGERNSAAAWLQLAELDYRLAHRAQDDGEPTYDFTAAQASVDRALALDPDLARAHILNGRILLEPFDHSEDADYGLWEEARASFLKANRLDPYDPLALYLYAQTFQRTGEQDAMVGPALETAFGFRPEATEFRSALAMHYASEGKYDTAIALLQIIANNPHSDNQSAKEAIARLEQAKAGGGPLPIGAIAIESEDEDDESDMSATAG
jgi:tetratricopeptide (TPR) repeat protein